ncbi:unnamed protein product, partial [Pylaiella littoralis]
FIQLCRRTSVSTRSPSGVCGYKPGWKEQIFSVNRQSHHQVTEGLRARTNQGFTWTTKISTGRGGGEIDGQPTFLISAGAPELPNIGVEIPGGTERDDGSFLGKIL